MKTPTPKTFDVVWRGTYTEKDGTEFEATISVNSDALASYFGYGRMGNAVFRKVRSIGHVIGFRLRRSVKIELTKRA